MATSAASIALQLQKLSNEATEKSFKYNTQEATTARNWQTQMSNTSHQREVEDLKKAGLNPVLSSGGSGAQSYTTSSASAQADSPVSAVGNVWSSQIGADATRAAAAQSAKAMKYAAAQQAAAARYAASMQYAAQKDSWKWKTDFMQKEYKAKTDYMQKEYAQKVTLANSIPVSSVGGVLDKIAQRSGLYDLVGTRTVKNVVSSMKGFLDNAPKYFNNTGKVTLKNFALNTAGRNLVNAQLSRLGLAVNNKNRLTFVGAVVFGNSYYQNLLINSIPKKSNSAVRHKYSGIQVR